MENQPHFKPVNDWQNIKNWIEKDDAKRNQLMRLAVREEMKPIAPFMNRVGRLEVFVLLLAVLDIGTLVYIIVQS